MSQIAITEPTVAVRRAGISWAATIPDHLLPADDRFYREPTDEVIAVLDPMRRHGGIYCAHLRSEADDILPAIGAMDADVISIETARSQMELLEGFARYRYPAAIGPGVYDIHSPRVPTVEAMVRLLQRACEVIPWRCGKSIGFISWHCSCFFWLIYFCRQRMA